MFTRKVISTAILSAGLAGLTVPSLASHIGYYRTPTLHETHLIFSSEGDLWKAQIGATEAHRLTSHPEEELNPHVSPDGQWIAFNASYDGGTDVYVMPLEGGSPKQVTFENGGVTVRGWTPDGKILFASRLADGPTGRLMKTVDPTTLTVEALPVADANDAAYNARGDKVFFTRFGLANNADNAKLYRGGGLSQLWYFNPNNDREAVRIAADIDAPILHPMWADGRIYFVTDKGGSDNIWSMNERGEDMQTHTRHEAWDVRSPQINGNQIIYRLGADIRILNLQTGQDSAVDLSIVGDHDFNRQFWIEKPLNYLSSANMGPNGKQVALTARGRVAVASPGPLRRIEFDTPGTARARGAVVGAEGKWVYVILDDNDRGEIWRYPINGIGEGEQVTNDAIHHRWGISPSPDGKYLAHYDKDNRLWILNLETNDNTLIEQSAGLGDDNFFGFSWSQDGQYLSYSTGTGRGINEVKIYGIAAQESRSVTTQKYNSHSGTFSADGKWLYFLSDRHFRPAPGAPWGDRNMGIHFDKRTKIYALALDKEARFPFSPDDELSLIKPENEKKTEQNEEETVEKSEKSDPKIDWDGLTARLYAVPVQSGNYSNLKFANDALYVLDRSGNRSSLKYLKITNEKPKITTFAGNVANYDLSADGKSLFYALGGGNANRSKMYIVKAGSKAPKDLSNAQLRTSDWRLAIQPKDEWRQLFGDAWRLHRDFAFDPKLRGLDWDQIRDKYEPLVSRVGHRAELTDLIGQMTSELGILHSQLGAGDIPRDERKNVAAFLGAVFEPAENGLRIKNIYQAEAGLPEAASPLARAGVDVREGDILTRVNGTAIETNRDLNDALAHQANQQVIITLERGSTTHQVVVKPINGRGNFFLRYNDWVERKRTLTQTLKDDADIGYLHIRAMGPNDIAAFARDFYAHADKDGLIIDVRSNRGGNIDSLIIEKLLRKVWSFWHFNGRQQPYGNMQQTFRGHLAILVDQATYSDGETFAAAIKSLKLGQLIGTQTAGAGIWLSDRNRLADGGIARIAELPQFGLDGRWLIEGRGVSPDIEVVNMPRATFNGKDAQLERAVQYLKDQIKRDPVPELKAQPIPAVGINGQDVN